VFFELTKEQKVARAAAIRCDVFIDDLPEILKLPGFPDRMRRTLFDPADQFPDSARCMENVDRFVSWAAIAAELTDATV
jgi:hypothetical protein